MVPSAGKSSRASVWPTPDRQTDKSYCATVHSDGHQVGKGAREREEGDVEGAPEGGELTGLPPVTYNTRPDEGLLSTGVLHLRTVYLKLYAARPRNHQPSTRRPGGAEGEVPTKRAGP